jgi:hypothetical protein
MTVLLPLGAFLKENRLSKNAGNGRAFSILTARGGGLTRI